MDTESIDRVGGCEHGTDSERDFPWLRRENSGSGWLQFGLSIPSIPTTDLYQALGELARDLLDGPVTNFFFMHKLPGLRVRFELAAPDARAPIRRTLERWLADGLVEGITPGVYEPEQVLFGGPVSMEHVHRLFTIDSLAWLDHHTDGGTNQQSPVNLSLAVLRGLFDDLDIIGWESRDVWDRLRRVADRRFTEPITAEVGFTDMAGRIRRVWAPDYDLAATLTPSEQAVVRDYRRAASVEVERWRKQYFDTENARVGPREAAAYLTIFHWNRSRIPAVRQTVIVESLARED